MTNASTKALVKLNEACRNNDVTICQQSVWNDQLFRKKCLERVPGIETCLTDACIHSGADILRHVINEGAELNKTDANGNNKLHLVCQTKIEPAEKIQILLKEKPSLAKQRNASGLLPVHYAVRRSNIDCLKRLLRHSPSTVNARTRDRRLTPLHIAAHFGLKAHVEFLLSFFKTDVNALDANRHASAPRGRRRAHGVSADAHEARRLSC